MWRGDDKYLVVLNLSPPEAYSYTRIFGNNCMKVQLGELRKIVREALISDYELSPSGRGSFSGVPISEWSTEQVMGAWAKHARNRYELMFYLKNGTVEEKTQASHELELCDRKLAFWEKHSEFDPKLAGEISKELAAEWKTTPIDVAKRKIPAQNSSTPKKSPFSSPTAMPAPGSKNAEEVLHKTFGKGTIVRKLDDGKVQVRFGSGAVKTLDMSFLTPVK